MYQTTGILIDFFSVPSQWRLFF